MTVLVTDGVLGVEATWTLNGVVMNDLESGFPRVNLKDPESPSGDFAETSSPAAGRYGEVPVRSRLAGKSLTLSGTIEAQSLPDLRALGSALRTAASMTDDTALVVAPNATWGTVAWTIFGRPIAYSPSGKWGTSPHAQPAYQQDFVLTFRARDPRAFAIALPATATAADGVSATITPGGRAPTEPLWTIAGPAGATLDLTSNDTGRKVRFVNVPLLAGHSLVVDFGGVAMRRSATIDGVDVSGYIDWSQSDWWNDDTYGLSPGANSIKSTGAGTWGVLAYPAVFS